MTTKITAADSRLLINALGANGAFSALSGISMLIAPAAIAGFLGPIPEGQIFEMGIMLLLFGAVLLTYFMQKRVRKIDAIVVSVLDLGWVIGSIALINLQPNLFSEGGSIAVIAVGVIVLTFFDLQILALWKYFRQQRDAARAITGSNAAAG